MVLLDPDIQRGLWSALTILVAVAIALAAHGFFFAVAERAARRTRHVFDDSLLLHGRGPARLMMPIFALRLAAPRIELPPAVADAAAHVLSLALIASVAWMIIRFTRVLDDVVEQRFRLDVADNLLARRVRTQAAVVARIVQAVVVVLAFGAMLMTFPGVRQVGASLLASAGIAGLAIGIAARPALENLFAGLQLALTQPIRIDDVVIVEGEWGRIEEIGTTYVVVRIWDLRRLVVPLRYFIEHPFQNWTRSTADLLGTVFLHLDYTVPVDEVRAELHRILQATKLWDGKVWNLQVTDATEKTMTLRALMSAPDAGTAWDLRCHVRERLIDWLQRRHPQALPRMRAEVDARTPPPERRGNGRDREHESAQNTR